MKCSYPSEGTEDTPLLAKTIDLLDEHVSKFCTTASLKIVLFMDTVKSLKSVRHQRNTFFGDIYRVFWPDIREKWNVLSFCDQEGEVLVIS